jgi:hypothetical protein
MEIIFAGICCWVDTPAGTGKTVILPNALSGGTVRTTNQTIPGHTAFIHAKQGDVDVAQWPSDMSGGDNQYFWFGGQTVTFDPPPTGGAINIDALPHVRDNIGGIVPICTQADIPRPGALNNPDPAVALALVRVPAGQVVTFTNGRRAILASLILNTAPVTIIATPFRTGTVRRLTITNANARVVIANTTFGDYVREQGAADNHHQFLYCDMFLPTPAVGGFAARPIAPTVSVPNIARIAPTEVIENARAELLADVTGRDLHNANRRDMRSFFDTLAVGCSNSQWP